MTVTTLLVQLAFLLIAAKTAGWLCSRIGMPPVLGQLLIGVLVGPSVLGWIHPDSLINSFASIGVILLMFVAGLETDMKQMKQVGGAAFISAGLGVIFPFIAGSVFAYALGYSIYVSLFLGTLLTATSVSISAQTLKDMGRLNSKEGTTILGAAVIDDVMGLIVLSVILALALGGNPVWSIIKMLAYFPIAYLIGHYGFPLLSRWLPRLLATEARLGLILALVLLYAWSAEELGNIAAITGAYIAGILVSRTEMRDWVHDGISKIGYAFLIPIFFIYVGIQADLHGVWHISPVLIVSFLLLSVLTKVIGCGGGALLSRFRLEEALVVGVGMISRGEVALITASIGLQAGLISQSLFSLVILMALFTTMLTPLLLRLVYPAPQQDEKDLALVPPQLIEAVEEVIHRESPIHLQEESHVR